MRSLYPGFFFILIFNYASAQKLDWAVQTPQKADDTRSFAIDKYNNLYVGPDRGDYGNSIYKYDKDGNLLWTFYFKDSLNEETLFKFALADDGSVYAVSNHDLFKLSSQGQLEWLKTDTPYYDVAAGKNGSVIVVGAYSSVVEKLDSSGNLIWRYEFNPTTFGGFITITRSGNIVAPIFSSISKSTYGAIMLDSNGNKLWQVVDSINQSYFQNSYATLYADSENNIYLSVGVNIDDYHDSAFTDKYDPSGTLLLVKPGLNLFNLGFISKSGNLYLPGDSAAILIYDDSLNYLGRFNYPLHFNSAYFLKLAGSSNRVYACGTLNDGTDKILLATFDLNGNPEWYETYAAYSPNFEAASNIVADQAGAIFVAGLVNNYTERVLLKYTDTSAISGIFEADQLINKLNVFPNPFSNEINFTYTLSAAGLTEVEICDLNGNTLSIIKDEMEIAGMHSSTWKPKLNVAPGEYLLKIVTPAGCSVKEISFIR